MEAMVVLPFVIGLMALARAAYLKGWKGLAQADYRPRIPNGAKYGLAACLMLQLGFGLLFQFKLIDVSLARTALSPAWWSLAVSLFSGWILVLNWERKG